jgi:hypothetical protein
VPYPQKIEIITSPGGAATYVSLNTNASPQIVALTSSTANVTSIEVDMVATIRGSLINGCLETAFSFYHRT